MARGSARVDYSQASGLQRQNVLCWNRSADVGQRSTNSRHGAKPRAIRPYYQYNRKKVFLSLNAEQAPLAFQEVWLYT
ncbi:hypothetical protein GCM10023185_08530 [Hymenobacter saemangeumensis]|uniref:Uncharacterized protein n=1 Tax=Hymenobacter saemangeumensis TaxID=1084522 RepID=A0ABP8I3L7_9BACT